MKAHGPAVALLVALPVLGEAGCGQPRPASEGRGQSTVGPTPITASGTDAGSPSAPDAGEVIIDKPMTIATIDAMCSAAVEQARKDSPCPSLTCEVWGSRGSQVVEGDPFPQVYGCGQVTDYECLLGVDAGAKGKYACKRGATSPTTTFDGQDIMGAAHQDIDAYRCVIPGTRAGSLSSVGVGATPIGLTVSMRQGCDPQRKQGYGCTFYGEIGSTDQATWNAIVRAFGDKKFDAMDLDAGAPPLDSATWTIEESKAGQYRKVTRYSPSSGAFHDLCCQLMALGGDAVRCK